MKWNYAQHNFPLLTLYSALVSAGVLWRHADAAQWIAENITRLTSIGHTIYWLQWWVTQHSVLSSTGKLKTKDIFKPLTATRLSLLYLPGVPQNFHKRLLLGKYSFKTSNSSRTHSPLFGEKFKCFTVGAVRF